MFETNALPNAPSNELVRQLTELRLCRPADFRRARSRVRNLARDLPAFDSVWIDALVQLRRLTPYQARVLEEESAEQLRIGPYLAVDELGHGPHATTYLVRSPDRSERFVVKKVRVAADQESDCQERLTNLLGQTSSWSHPHLVVPHTLLPCKDHELMIVSRWIPGVRLGELLVRRGRFPSSVVVEVARQLSEGLAALHRRGVVHGDIRLANVRLTSRGAAVLVDGGIRPAICPELTIHESRTLESYDGIAPELIGTGVAANVVSEIYALGCLLWQLLAGRPPYPVADPLMKLAAHQTQRIVDVRSWAPDTPSSLAELIFAMTSPQPNERPQSFADLLQRWGRPGMASRSRLKRYRRLFDGAVPHFTQPTAGIADRRWPWIAVSLLVIAGAVLTVADKGMRNEVLAITHRVVDAIRTTGEPKEPTESVPASLAGSTNPGQRTAGGLLPLPAPSVNGEIVLAEIGPYDVADVATSGRLTIRGAAGVNPVIRIARAPLRLAAESVTLVDLAVHSETPSTEEPIGAMLLVRSQRVTIQNCEFVGSLREAATRPKAERNSSIVAWQPLDRTASEAGQIEIENTIFSGRDSAFWFAESPHHVKLSNCLKLGEGACFSIARKANARPVAFELNRLTMRDSGPLLRFGGAYAERADAAKIEIAANDCVLAMASTSLGLVEIQSTQPRAEVRLVVELNGRGTVVPPGLELMAAVDSVRGIAEPIVDADEQFQGLVVSELEFAGDAGGDPDQSELVGLSAPRSSTDAGLPGVDVTRLPSRRRN